MRQIEPRNAPSKEDAEAIALQGLTFLAADSQRLVRFLSLTGISPQDLKAWASAPHLQAAVLDHFLADESLLVVFAADAKIAPGCIAPARAVLVGERVHAPAGKRVR